MEELSVSNSASAMHPVRVLNFIPICAHSNIHIAEACVGFKAANRKRFPYIMHIVDELQKNSLECFDVYGTYVATYICMCLFYHDHLR